MIINVMEDLIREKCSDLLYITPEQFASVCEVTINSMGISDGNILSEWKDMDDCDRIGFIMNIEKIMHISIHDEVAEIITDCDDLGWLVTKLRNHKINEIIGNGEQFI